MASETMIRRLTRKLRAASSVIRQKRKDGKTTPLRSANRTLVITKCQYMIEVKK